MKYLLPLFLFFFVALTATAQDHSGHHEQLTAEQLGTVHFPISCSPVAQKSFSIGVALLHSFWYSEAEKQFKQAARVDPQCAMAHWGIAMSSWHQLWDHPEKAAVSRGLKDLGKAKRLDPHTGRERDYLAAVTKFYSGSSDHQARATAYSNAMEAMSRKYPEDSEAAIFYGLSLLASEPENDTTFVNRKKAADVLEKEFAKEPRHPGIAHYLIHSYDKPGMAKLGLPAARRYAQIAPAAPHALHMPSHIFERLGLWQDDIDSNLASVAATKASTAMHMGGAEHQIHAMDFLEYAYLQSGRDAEAKKVMEDLNKMHGVGSDYVAYAKLEFAQRYLVELHRWQEASSFPLPPASTPGQRAIVYYVRALGAGRNGDAQAARDNLKQLDGIRHSLRPSKNEKDKELFTMVDQYCNDVEPWVMFSEGKSVEAIKMMRDLADKADEIGEQRDSPNREMLADMLTESKQPKLALLEYQTSLRLSPNRFNSLYGAARAAELTGDADVARNYYAQLLKVCEKADSDRVELSRAKGLLAQQ